MRELETKQITGIENRLQKYFFFNIEKEILLSLHLKDNLTLLRTAIGEGNGTPLQYSCLENPMDGGAW